MRRSCVKILLLSLFGIPIFFSQYTLVSAALITDVRFWSAPDHTRVVLDLTEPVQYESFSQENPPQCHLEIKEAILFTKKREMKVDDSFLTKVNLSVPGEGKVKLILHQKKPLQANILTLKPYLDKPHRLVIDLIDMVEEKKEQEERQKQKEIRPKGTKIVVIDPGHGGEDPGALGLRGTLEKDVVLRIGQKIVYLLNQDNEVNFSAPQPQRVKAFLTRKGDYFILLEERAKIARDYGADLFISLHADGSFNPQARGSSVYCLSLSGATDEAAKILADKENLSNVLGGAISKPASVTKDPNRDQILLDLMQNNSMRESFRFAEIFLETMKGINHLKYTHYRQANFIVLKAPYFPSALVETAFITNKEDERLLNQSDFHEKFGKALAASIKKYFKQ
jgi:N-acetylmuramoyl-L-alanine amidase